MDYRHQGEEKDTELTSVLSEVESEVVVRV